MRDEIFINTCLQNATEKMKLSREILSDAENVVTGSCTRREQKDVSFFTYYKTHK